MDDFDKIDFKVDFDGLPETEEELKKGLSAEDQKILSEAGNESDLESLLNEKDSAKLLMTVLGKKDSPSFVLTQHELVDAVFHSPLFTTQLNEKQKKVTGQFLETVAPANKKFYTRGEVIEVIRSLILVIVNSE